MIMSNTMTKLETFTRGDGAHWGLTDWYPENEAALAAVIAAATGR